MKNKTTWPDLGSVLKEMLIRLDERTVLASKNRQPANRDMVRQSQSDQDIVVV